VNGATSRAQGRLTLVTDFHVAPEPVETHLDDLMTQVALGDEPAFAALYDRTSSKIFGLVRRVVRDPAQAEEVTQEVYLQVWRQAVRFDATAGSAIGWILTMAHRRAVDRVRSAQAATARDVRALEIETVTPHDHVVEAVEQRLDAERVRRCLDGLTALQRQSVTLAYYQGYTYAEVGSVLDVPLGTVKTRMRDGLVRLRDCMGVSA